MKKIFFILIVSIYLFADAELEKERELQLQTFTNFLKIEELSNDCKSSIKEMIKMTIEYNTAFDNYLKYKDGRFNKSYNIADDNLKNAEKYFSTICTKNELEIIEKSTK